MMRKSRMSESPLCFIHAYSYSVLAVLVLFIVFSLLSFTDAVINIRNRHNDVIPTMAQGLVEYRETYGTDPVVSQNVQYFLDRFYMSRISIRMLLNQHSEIGFSSLFSQRLTAFKLFYFVSCQAKMRGNPLLTPCGPPWSYMEMRWSILPFMHSYSLRVCWTYMCFVYSWSESIERLPVYNKSAWKHYKTIHEADDWCVPSKEPKDMTTYRSF
ncbi:hypothetical protein XENOCAPTIV_000535 [Xenoophorus captivus]|uniref:Protein-serine/threonine kinase n=1 Tax=Xenoophorus captivus TaxID=1517983 RepID=A0ABV0REM7_9TELE